MTSIATRKWRLRLIALWGLAVTSAAVGRLAHAAVDYEWPLSGPTTATYGPEISTAVTASTTSAGYSAASLCNNSGMSGTMYPQDRHDAVGGNMWMSTANDPNRTVVIDLGKVYPIGKIAIWNFNQYSGGVSYSGRGAKWCYIGYSANGTSFTWPDGGAGYGLFELAKGSTTGADIGPTNLSSGNPVDFKGAPARYVKFWCHANWGGAPGDGSNVYYGLSEVRIYRYASAVAAAGDFIAAKTVGWSSAFNADSPAETTTNNSGMSDAGSGAYTSAGTVGTTSGWHSVLNDPNPYVIYDLGGAYTLDRMYVWNYNGVYYFPLWGRGIKNASIYYTLRNHPLAWTKLVGPNADQTWTFNHASSTAGQGYTDAISFGNKLIRYVKIVPNVGMNNGNWGGTYGDTQPYYALSQVRFFAGPGTVVEPAPWWTGVMGQRSATTNVWGGADDGASIWYPGPGGAARSFFAFSDTFVDKWDPTTYERVNGGFLNNTSAIWSGTATLTPSLANMAFDVSHSFVPNQTLFPGEYYWLTGGIYVGSNPGVLYVFGQRREGLGDESVQTGMAMMALPVTSGNIGWGSQTQYEPPFLDVNPSTGRVFRFGHSALDRTAQDGYIYIYGSVEDPDPGWKYVTSSIVARCAPADITNFNNWTFYNGSTWVSGSGAFKNSAPISPNVVGTTTTIGTAFDAGHAGQIMMMTNSHAIGPVSISYATNPWGPFDTWTTLYYAPENDPDWYDGQVLTYDTQYHPELSLAGEALVSYSINTKSETYQDNADLYHTRFIRIRTVQ